MKTLYETDTGNIVAFGNISYIRPKQKVIEDVAISGDIAYVKKGKIVYYTEEQAARKANTPMFFPVHWSNDVMQWIDDRDLTEMKQTQRDKINASRELANETSFTFDGREISSSIASRSAIDAIQGRVARTGKLPASFSGQWKADDNSFVDIKHVKIWDEFYDAMLDQVARNFDKSQHLKQLIDLAESEEEVKAITW